MTRLSNTRYKSEIRSRGKSVQLAVVVHGYGSSPSDLKDVILKIEELLPEADLLIPHFPASLLSNHDPQDFAEDLVVAIDEAERRRTDERCTYTEILLVGHSIGAVIARKAYLFAMGQTQDRVRVLASPPYSWTNKITRIVLLAGMNRGWSIHRKPRDMRWHKYLAIAVASTLIRFLPFGRFAQSVQRGSPFITNLRIQWLNVIRADNQPPLTLQLLGDSDDIVAALDNIDLECGAKFKYLQVPNTGHANIIDFSGPHGANRADLFRIALLTPEATFQTETLTRRDRNWDVEHFVFVVHGIRDFGFWTRPLAQQIESSAKAGTVRTTTAGYGYFPMIDFLLIGERQKNVRWFMDEYTQALAMYPAASMNFVGHSNGTYLLASSLNRYKACSFRNVVFAGSVVHQRFNWDPLVPHRVRAIRNYVASADWVVGWFPRFFEYFPSPDIGSAGFQGFTSREGNRHEYCFAKGGHSAAIDPLNFDAIAAFVLKGKAEDPPPKLVAGKQSAFVKFFCRFAFLVWAALVILIAEGFYLVVAHMHTPVEAACGAMIYVAILFLIMKNL